MNESSDASPRVLAVVVTHNGREWLPHCLKSLSEQDYSSINAIVVDTASERSPARLVRQLLPEAEFARLDSNVGFGAAANHALETSADAPTADYYLFLHDDVWMEPDCVTRMVEAAIATDAGVVGGKGLAWDHPSLLLEVGLSADQLGFPYTGLETGEIDQGQHVRKEVLFVTNACILISRPLIERCGSWDGAYFAFGEDLDLCLRGRLAGFRAIVEPAAQFRHAVALAQGKRKAETEPIRFYTRRNRLRTIAKTAAAYRLWAVLLLYLFVVTSEIVLLASLRRFEELRAYPRAFASFLLSIPDVFRRRRAVQKRRAVPDRRIRRLMVSDIHRARVFAERRLREWEVGTLRFGERTLSQLHPAALRATFSRWITKPATIGVGAVVIVFMFAGRQILFGGALGAGGIWPFPEPTRTLLGDYFASWRDVGLGTSSAAPPALPLLWLAGLVSFGDAGLAQILLIAILVGAGLAGMYRLMARRTAMAGPRVAGVAVYALGPVTGFLMSRADLGALALFAGAPHLLDIGLRILGPTPSEHGERPATPGSVDALVQDAVRLALVSAVVVALAPSAYLALLFLWLIVAFHSYAAAWDRREVIKRSGWLIRSLVVTALLLLPWTIEAMRPRGAILGPIFSGRGGGGTYRPLWEAFGFHDTLLLRPEAGVLAAVATATILLSALVLSTPPRRREARLLVTVVIAFAAAGGLAANGWVPAPSASLALWMVIPAVCVAVAAGHLVAGLAEDLPRHAVGIRQGVAFLLLLALAVGIIGGWGPQIAGWKRPASTLAAPVGEVSESLSSFFVSTAEETGDFRILWLGRRWVDPIRSAAGRKDATPYFLTGSEGLTMRDLYDPPPSDGERRLDEVVGAMTGGRLDHAGHLLAPMGIQFLVVDREDEALISAMQRQLDLKLEQSQIAVFRNLRWVPRAVLAPPGLAEVVTATSFDERGLLLADWKEGLGIPAKSQASFRGELPNARPPAILLGDNYNSGWRGRVEGTRLVHSKALGWANRFDLPLEARGSVSISYGRRWPRVIWIILQGLIVAMSIAMARLRGGTVTV